MVSSASLSSRFVRELDGLSLEDTERLLLLLTELVNLHRALRRFSRQLDVYSASEVRYFAEHFEVEQWPLEFCEAVIEHINFHAAPTTVGSPPSYVTV